MSRGLHAGRQRDISIENYLPITGHQGGRGGSNRTSATSLLRASDRVPRVHLDPHLEAHVLDSWDAILQAIHRGSLMLEPWIIEQIRRREEEERRRNEEHPRLELPSRGRRKAEPSRSRRGTGNKRRRRRAQARRRHHRHVDPPGFDPSSTSDPKQPFFGAPGRTPLLMEVCRTARPWNESVSGPPVSWAGKTPSARSKPPSNARCGSMHPSSSPWWARPAWARAGSWRNGPGPKAPMERFRVLRTRTADLRRNAEVEPFGVLAAILRARFGIDEGAEDPVRPRTFPDRAHDGVRRPPGGGGGGPPGALSRSRAARQPAGSGAGQPARIRRPSSAARFCAASWRRTPRSSR